MSGRRAATVAKILFLAHRVPYPPDKGDKIRAYHLLQQLAPRHEIWLGAGVDEDAAPGCADWVRTISRDACLPRLGPVRRSVSMALGGAAGLPLSVARFGHPTLRRWVCRVLGEVRPDVVWVHSSALARYALGPARVAPLIVDFVDADAEKWRAYAEATRPPLSWVYRAEFERLVRYERRVMDEAAAGVVISEAERRLQAALQPRGADRLRVISNGVDAGYFHPAEGPSAEPAIVLCGRMDYAPNVDGAEWFAKEVLPMVRARTPAARFLVVGASPTAAVRSLARLPGVDVTGTVPDVRPYLARAAVVVAPLRIARGVQNKVLEAMASARPVVATPQATQGIGARGGEELLIAADAVEFAERVRQVLAGEWPRLGEQGRRYVLERHSWEAEASEAERLIASVARRA